MSGRILGLSGRLAWFGLAVAAVATVVVFGVALAAAGLAPLAREGPTPSPVVSPAPTDWLRSIGPGQVAMPDDADCAACHVFTNGEVGVKDIPVIPHPIVGWTDCTACHDPAGLVQTAPGHSGIHADQCLICHKQSVGAAPPPAHATAPNADCLSCHGVTAPLPSDMSHRPGQLCWLCHLSPTSSAAPAFEGPGSSGLLPTAPAWSPAVPDVSPGWTLIPPLGPTASPQ